MSFSTLSDDDRAEVAANIAGLAPEVTLAGETPVMAEQGIDYSTVLVQHDQAPLYDQHICLHRILLRSEAVDALRQGRTTGWQAFQASLISHTALRSLARPPSLPYTLHNLFIVSSAALQPSAGSMML